MGNFLNSFSRVAAAEVSEPASKHSGTRGLTCKHPHFGRCISVAEAERRCNNPDALGDLLGGADPNSDFSQQIVTDLERTHQIAQAADTLGATATTICALGMGLSISRLPTGRTLNHSTGSGFPGPLYRYKQPK